MSPDLEAKRLEMLAEVIPGAERVGVLWDPTFPTAALELKAIERAARLLNVELQPFGVRAAEELEAVLAAVGQRVQALIVMPSLLFTEQQRRIAALAVKNRLPTVLSRREQVRAGGLMSYGTNFSDTYRRAASYVDISKYVGLVNSFRRPTA